MKICNSHCRQSANHRFIDCTCEHGSHMFVNEANNYDTPDCNYGTANAMRAAALRFIRTNRIDHSVRIFHGSKSNGKWLFTSLDK